MCGKNQVFARQKRQFVHNEGNNALSSRRRNAISCDPSVGDKVESGAQLVFFCPICGLKNNERRSALCLGKHFVSSTKTFTRKDMEYS